MTLDPELALALFIAPVLLDAAFDASPRDLREHWRPVASLALIAVALTVAAAFPQRDLVLFVAFGVVLGTLVIQGLTLRSLMHWLGLEHDDAVDREVRLAREETARAAAAAVDGQGDQSELGRLVRQIYESRLAANRPRRIPVSRARSSAGLSPPSVGVWWSCGTRAPSATTPFTESRRTSTRPSSTPRRCAGGARQLQRLDADWH